MEALPTFGGPGRPGDETPLRLSLANAIHCTESHVTHGFPGTLQVGWGQGPQDAGALPPQFEVTGRGLWLFLESCVYLHKQLGARHWHEAKLCPWPSGRAAEAFALDI